MKKISLSLIAIAFAGNFSHAQTFNPTYSINSAGTANTLTGGYTFAYTASGSPWNGAFMSFGGFNNTYDCQVSTDYGPSGGNHISFRTRNGDAGTWNSWYEMWHSGNLNNSSSDFTARNINTSGIHVVSGTYSSLQGLYLGWNRSGSLGEVNFVSNIGSGFGGFTFDDTSDGLTFTRLMTILGSGNVGIGTANPDQKLTVKGTIHSQEVIVDMSVLPDYVFKPTYHLPTLAEVKAYIDQNHHLPEMPSANQVAKDGLSLGDMNAKLLKKVEELTLYLIEQQEINRSLQAQITNLVNATKKDKKQYK